MHKIKPGTLITGTVKINFKGTSEQVAMSFYLPAQPKGQQHTENSYYMLY